MGANVVCCMVVRDKNVAHSYAVAKWGYCALFALVSIVAWVLSDHGEQWFLDNSRAFAYCKTQGYESLCSGKQIAVRFSLASLCFFGAHAALLFWCCKESDPRGGIHTGLWFWKLLAWAGATVGFFFVPSYAVVAYAQVARVGAGAFLVYVMVQLVSWVNDANRWLVTKDTRAAWAALVAASAMTFLGGLALIGASYHYYAPSGSCHLSLFFVTWSLVTGLALAGVLFVPGRLEIAGLFTSGTVFLYCSYLLYGAIGREPGGGCVREAVGDRWVQVVGFVIAIGALAYSAATLGTSSPFQTDKGPVGIGGGTGGGGAAAPALGSDGGAPLPYRPDVFHLVYALASMYMAMLLTDWRVPSRTQGFEVRGSGWASMWVMMAAKWFCEALYLWTVLAPAVFRGRDFS